MNLIYSLQMPIDILYIITLLVSALASVLAWIAKITWAKEHMRAKNEILKAKNTQIELLQQEINSFRELTPMKLREYFLSVRTQLEEYNDLLTKQLAEAHADIKNREQQIASLKNGNEKELLELLVFESDKVKDRAVALEAKLTSLEQINKASNDSFSERIRGTYY